MGRLSSGMLGSVLILTMFATVAMTVPTGVSSQGEEAVVKIGYMQPVDSLNPFIGLTDSSRFFYSLVYDSLMSIDENLEPTPNLAREWRMVPEDDAAMIVSGEPYGSVWEYNLTSNANWTDGEPFTATDVVFTLNLNAGYYDTAWAYQPYAFFIDYAEAVDSDTVRVHFADRTTGEPIPCAYGDSLQLPILPEHLLGGLTPFDICFAWDGIYDTVDPPIVGTGPFMPTANLYDEFLDGDEITLVRNPYYHGLEDYGKEIRFDGLVMMVYDDATAMRYFLEAGDLDVAQFPAATYVDLKAQVELGAVEDIVCFDSPKPNQYWTEVAINMNDAGPNPARLDPAVRVAMALATNKTQIVEDFYLGQGTEGSTLISPASEYWHYEPSFNESYRYNLDNASNLLEVSGYEFTVESPTVRVATADSWAVQEGLVTEGTPLVFDMMVRMEYPEEGDIAAYLEYVWAQVGIDINYRVVSEAVLATMVYSYSYDTAIWYWSSDPDPNYMLFCESSYAINGWNDNCYMDAEYDENYTASVSALDPADRKAYVDACQLIHYWDAPYIILAYPNQTYAWRTDTFTGWGEWGLPGRSLDNYWGANPVLFDLVAIPLEPDTTPPETDCGLDGTVGEADWYVTPVTVELSAEDLIWDGTWTNYSVDGGSWQPYSLPFEVSGDGDHTVEYYSTDYGGNVEEVEEVSFKIDATAPGTVDFLLAGTIAAGTDWFTTDVTVSLHAPDDETSGVAVIMYSIDSGAAAAYVGAFPVDNDGMHNISFYCTDGAGNDGEDAWADVWIDTTTPSVTVTSPTAGTEEESGDVTVEFTCSDATSGVVSAWVSVDDGTEAEADPEDGNYTLMGLADGTHTVTVRVVDEAGNDASMEVTFVVDTPADATVMYVLAGVVVAAAAGLVALLLLKRKGKLK